MKKGVSFLLALLMMLGLTACGKKAPETEEIDTGPMYRTEQIQYQAQMNYIESGCVAGDAIYLFGNIPRDGTKAEGSVGRTLLRVSLNGGAAEKLPSYEAVSIPEQVKNSTTDSRLHAVPDGSLMTYEKLENVHFLRRLDREGKELSRFARTKTELQDLLEAGDQEITDMLMDGDGDIFVKADRKIGVLSPSGELRFTLPTEEYKYTGCHLVLLGDGGISVKENIRDGEQEYTRLRTVDKDAQGWGTACILSDGAAIADGDSNTLFYYTAGEELYAWRKGAGAGEPVLSWLNAGYDGSTLKFFTVLPDGRLVVMPRGQDLFDSDMYLLTPAEDAPERTVITYATLGLTAVERESIMRFNKTNQEYQIRVKDYSDYSAGDTYDAAFTRLATEIGAGKIPDILAAYRMPLARWAAGGLLEDLWPWIDQDPELDRGDLMERVLQAASINGRLYEIGPDFCIDSAAGRKDVVGDRMTWTPEDMWSALERMPEGCVPLKGDKTELLSALMEMDWDRFIDWDKGRCSFDSNGFRSILEFCASMPDSGKDAELGWAVDGRLMLDTAFDVDFMDIQLHQFRCNGEISYVGYPNPWGEVGSSFFMLTSCAMTSACKNKEGAWTYMRTVLLPQGQRENDLYSFGFPINRSDFERLAKKAMKDDGVSRGTSIYVDGQFVMVDFHPVTQAEYGQLMELYNAIETFKRTDAALSDIITDTAGAYFAGDKTLDETAALIQNRAQLYVNEQK